MLYSCSGCKSFSTQPLGKIITDDKSIKYKPAIGPPVDRECAFCGWTHHIGGPIWLDPIHDLNFVKDVLTSLDVESHQYKTVDRLNGILTMITEELQDVPLHYTTQQLCTTLNTSMPKTQKLWSAIKNAGYKVSYSHTDKSSLKTNMPSDIMWDFMKCYARSDEAISKIPSEQSPGHKIVSTPIKFVADFTLREGVLPMSKVDNMKRFPENPPNWGPQSRAKKNKKRSNSSQDENISELQDDKKVRQETNNESLQ
ncbi:tRNA (guanine(26)-N(2))-dimethyltransferase isoform X2 [Oopsacas minuta]|uniref:tRNA (guanine(26)-N(2))-dimethyltransferase n=1 Tax=Oopsacas minuta TaxID=111878 RepID=A0AAV7KCX1_9METZ|nr:tRNA (guanine(26)-N(2))-dimethyltransferase isoform X2 [Oopsacas minuta]